jgi:predicted AlkP superfamily phosphohydrolase/phosphomutase
VGGGAAAHVRLRSPRIGTIEGSNDYGRTGEHRPDGLFIAAGRGIRRARHHGAAIVDFAPTIARMLGVVAPQTDGVIVSGLDRKIPLA